ncbi:hypothetical protein LJC20_01540 [Eubacteriales bacterium OttesenSCG-928-M02]|nr:hypothetical protein [Eubacteriales bacterium OttesenSCG-928-M02]
MSECIKRAPAHQRGSASNTSYIGTDIGVFLGSNLAGTVVSMVGYRAMYLSFTLPILLATLAFFLFEKKKYGSKIEETP